MSKQTGAHTHEEKGKNVPVILFFTGLALFFIGLFLGNMLLVKNILFSLAAILAGYHIIGEGFGDTYRDTKNNRKFSPNIHLLMTLAAVGSALKDFLCRQRRFLAFQLAPSLKRKKGTFNLSLSRKQFNHKIKHLGASARQVLLFKYLILYLRNLLFEGFEDFQRLALANHLLGSCHHQ